MYGSVFFTLRCAFLNCKCYWKQWYFRVFVGFEADIPTIPILLETFSEGGFFFWGGVHLEIFCIPLPNIFWGYTSGKHWLLSQSFSTREGRDTRHQVKRYKYQNQLLTGKRWFIIYIWASTLWGWRVWVRSLLALPLLPPGHKLFSTPLRGLRRKSSNRLAT